MPFRFRQLAKYVLHHLVSHGVVALLLAAAPLFWLRGLDFGLIVLVGLPPFLAVFFTRRKVPPVTRRIAWTFLVLIGLGALVADSPALFPKLGGFERRLNPWQDRMLTWYGAVYVFWFLVVLPTSLFLGSLRAHREGRPAKVSRPTCYLGLVTTGLLALTYPGVLGLLGFWPVF
jgi:hypothetical protein